MLPEVEFWCSPAWLELELGERPVERLGERPGERLGVSPVVRETNTTDHCLQLTGGAEWSNLGLLNGK